MPPTVPSDPHPPPPFPRPATDWGEAPFDSGFGALPPPAVAYAPTQRAQQALRHAPAGFDFCHVGLVLRAVLFVEATLALGILFTAPDLPAVLFQVALASGAALPGLLLWLALVCLLQRRMARLGARSQWWVAGALGGACGWAGWGLMDWAGQGAIDLGPGLAALLGGAFLGVLLTVWVQLRGRSQVPADATARLAELQSRIRPHFLFNTLNSALGLVHRDPARAEVLLEDLAELFRSALADGAAVVSLGEELELARRYLAIEQTRFGARLRLQWELDPAAAAARVPPLLLQPLVENAVRHGVEPSPEGGLIRIRTRTGRGQAWVTITNTLPDAPAARGATDSAGHGIALQNVRDRLRLMHDVTSSFEVQSDAGQFRVRIGLPL